MLFFTLLMFLSSPVHAGPLRIKVVAEPAARERAAEFIREVSRLEPFRQLIRQRKVIISDRPAIVRDLNCRGGHLGIPRLAACDTNRTRYVCSGADFCPLFTGVPNIGAGGRFNPISSATFPWTTMLHELVHSYGFTDDYGYTPTEAPIYCTVNDWPNGHWDNLPSSYPDAMSAQAACVERVPWCREALAAGTPVVHELPTGGFAIGSPPPASGCPSDVLGVYVGGSCQNMPAGQAWRPYFCPTVMGHPALGEDLCMVNRRHAIISRSPNLIPRYYQKVIFDEIVRRKQLRGLVFQPAAFEQVDDSFRYGLPVVDRLRHPAGPLPEVCAGEELELAQQLLRRWRGIASPPSEHMGCMHK